MRAHIIKDGKVSNIIEVESLDVIPGLISAEQGGDIGDSWDGAVFSKPPPPPLDRVATEVRYERNTKLFATDWTQGADVPPALKDKNVSYRQALRDVPAQSGFPLTITWPVAP